ncbi:hypothetical protein PG996_010510 [Apiospora saccharicola]|uniref:Uncharacterized protein n=1 Tax=Apiospora saccharicola TaxID=335842 RepID=A0ABR1UNS5_9PEZI
MFPYSARALPLPLPSGWQDFYFDKPQATRYWRTVCYRSIAQKGGSQWGDSAKGIPDSQVERASTLPKLPMQAPVAPFLYSLQITPNQRKSSVCTSDAENPPPSLSLAR